MGVVVRRYIDILTIILNFPYSSCIRSFLAAASLLLMFFWSCFCYFFTIYSNVTHRAFEIVQKNRDPANIIII